MKIQLKTQIFGFDADGEPLAGRVAATDGDRVLVTPTFYAPVWILASRCFACPPPEAIEHANELAKPPAPPAVPPGAAPTEEPHHEAADSAVVTTDHPAEAEAAPVVAAVPEPAHPEAAVSPGPAND